MSETSGNLPKRVIIIGGGVTGLAAAHRVVEITGATGQPAEVLLLEAAPRLGGTIVTSVRDDCLIEGGPDSFITQKPWALALCKRLGIDGELIPTNPACRRTFVVRAGKMHAIPEGFLLLAPSRIWPFVTSRLFSWPGKIRMGWTSSCPARTTERKVMRAWPRSCCGGSDASRWIALPSRWSAGFTRPIRNT
jgi:protoporphyrinogen/coproporphyrinogen III oxidase